MSSQIPKKLILTAGDTKTFIVELEHPIHAAFCTSAESVWKNSPVPHGVEFRLQDPENGIGLTIFVTTDGQEKIRQAKTQTRAKGEVPTIINMLYASTFVSLFAGLSCTLLLIPFGYRDNLQLRFLGTSVAFFAIFLIRIAIINSKRISK